VTENVDIAPSASDDNSISVSVDVPTPEESAPNVVIVDSGSDSGISADAALVIGERLGKLEIRLEEIATLASEANSRAEIATMVSEDAAATANSAEQEAITAEVIADEVTAPMPDPEPESDSSEDDDNIQPEREHWLWKNGKDWRFWKKGR
jgi:hypothetical protein